MFKIYDLNYKEVDLPKEKLGYGLRLLELSIGPIIYENVYNQSNNSDHLVKRYARDRDVSIEILFTSADSIDWRMKRDIVHEFFRSLGEFYIAEAYGPFKLLKVIVDESYDVDRPVMIWGQAEIPLKVLDTPFRKSLHTTKTIDAEGMQFNDKWAYGMGTWFSENYWQYSFTNEDPTFYNAGTEEVKLIQQKDSEITLTINSAPPNDLIDIDDGVTTFKLFKACEPGDVLKISGHKVTLNGVNVMGDTNGNFLTVKKGWNYWDIRGITDFKFEIDFRYLYD